jgi:hypothetical protein
MDQRTVVSTTIFSSIVMTVHNMSVYVVVVVVISADRKLQILRFLLHTVPATMYCPLRLHHPHHSSFHLTLCQLFPPLLTFLPFL